MKKEVVETGLEKRVKPLNGYGMLMISILTLAGSIFHYTQTGWEWLGGVLTFLTLVCWAGLIVVDPNNSRVLILFGSYKGSVKHNGFFFVNPLMIKKKISLRARNMETQPIKVNDKMGNPIMIAAVLVWKVEDTYRAAFEVERYEEFVKAQSESAIRQLAGSYSYDNIEDESATITLRSSHEEVNHLLEKEIAERLAIAGIVVIEARISHLAYAAEIAGAMLQRQQATAVVAARQKIVEGAVGMVDMALKELSEKEILHLDDERKAAMVSNLMVVLCSDKNPTPVVNTGTLYA
ncbi:MAG: SPFH domain-containing protein [Candidatus Competibacteraceae bacterium]|nr:SPFH domain-containing protein [Candidatus Competibacteraceae bacterium]